ncbi:MAG TPA: hypothetical protein DHV26_11465 [Cytophagales bacterium]|nr:hypothetical protein [Cytophagales bacterium]HRG10194.1 hypothetical protein [Cyclobacteriaceae bacterium]
MRTITLEVPDQVASILDSMSNVEKFKTLIIAALMAGKANSVDEILKRIDSRTKTQKLTETEINNLLNEIS